MQQVMQTFLAGAMLLPLRRTGQATGEKATGPLRVHPTNPRYFTDGSGKAIYLTGSHTWANLQDWGPENLPRRFDYAAYLDLLSSHHHNFIRMWAWESPVITSTSGRQHCAGMPYQRTGPGTAQDGGLKFDLNRLDQAYFDHLRARVTAARDRGIYVSIMLFQGWSVWQHETGTGRDPWSSHPYNGANNINGIDGDPNKNGEGAEVHSLRIDIITRLQEAYVRKVVDTVNDLDNVLYEISNEDQSTASTAWQYHVANYIHTYEKTHKAHRHPVGITPIKNDESVIDNSVLFASPAEWVSPGWTVWGKDPYQVSPPASDGRKVILTDTDHLWGEGGDHQWVWKSFLRGLNPIYMDRIAAITGCPQGDIPGAEGVRQAMGHTRTMADRMNLAAMTPRNDLASTEYCLADPGKEYLVYLPEGGEVTVVDLTAAAGTLTVEWVQPVEGIVTPAGTVTGGAKRGFRAPFNGDAVLHIALSRPQE